MSAPPSFGDARVHEGIDEMARRCYGYGCWDAPYWFIGPEQGQGRAENNDLRRRVEAWLHFGGGELSDCRDFHDRIGEKSWHCNKPKLQQTWRPLMLLLATFLERPADNESLRTYQRDKWGTLSGETCVIELSGLPASSLKIPRNLLKNTTLKTSTGSKNARLSRKRVDDQCRERLNYRFGSTLRVCRY